jgi:hypothetical protein
MSITDNEITETNTDLYSEQFNNFPIGETYLIYSLYNSIIASFIYTRFGFFKQICDQIYDKIDDNYNKLIDNYNKVSETYINNNEEIIKYKIDCLSDYVIMKKSNGDVICFGQNNIFNINDLVPCQIYFMRINYKTFEDLFTNKDININPSSKNEITNEYMVKFKSMSKVIISYIISKLNYEKKYEDIQMMIKEKIKISFPYKEVIYPTNKKLVYELQINSEEEKEYWMNSIKFYLKEMEEQKGIQNKINYSTNIFNFNHKYIHCIIPHKKFLETIMKKINELKKDFYKTIYNYITKNEIITSEIYTQIQLCLYAYNSCNRVQILLNNGEDTKLVYRLS